MTLGLFDAIGIELEYMIVADRDLSVAPLADALLVADHGSLEPQVADGPISWSNELALHVIELKTEAPAPELAGLATRFWQSTAEINRRLARFGARLMPTAMHPWMDPHTELRLWPHDDDSIYRTFDRIFDCTGHGWANLQSVHINLPFRGDDELARLHAAIRLILPILPALAASSPIMNGALTGALDNRLRAYATNSRKVPSVTGAIIPEIIHSRADYERDILEVIYRDLAPHDPEGVLRYEWVNSRGAIARFDRDSIEIRLLDIQECPRADLAICAVVVSTVRALVEERLSSAGAQRSFPIAPLCAILERTVAAGDLAVIGASPDEARYLALLGRAGPCTANELWQHLSATCLAVEPGADEWLPALDVMARHGCLARRIVTALGGPDHTPSRDSLIAVYRRLCACLAENHLFVPTGAARRA